MFSDFYPAVVLSTIFGTIGLMKLRVLRLFEAESAAWRITRGIALSFPIVATVFGGLMIRAGVASLCFIGRLFRSTSFSGYVALLSWQQEMWLHRISSQQKTPLRRNVAGCERLKPEQLPQSKNPDSSWLRLGCWSLRTALASIWRIRSRVTLKMCPTSSSV